MTLPDEVGGNLLSPLPDASAGEIFCDIVRRPRCRIERIVSQGQVTPMERPYRQDHDEWVLVLQGRAEIDVEGRVTVLGGGDHIMIPGGAAHRVTFTDPDAPTVWLAVHIDEDEP